MPEYNKKLSLSFWSLWQASMRPIQRKGGCRKQRTRAGHTKALASSVMRMPSYTAVILAAVCVSGATAFVGTPALSSVGKHVLPSAIARDSRSGAMSGIVMMGKGKGVPINMRGNVQRQQQAQAMKDQMMGDDSDGFPVFTIYARSSVAKVWYPCGSMKGDDRSKALVESWRDNVMFLKDQYKNTLDKGMAKSLFTQKDKFLDSVVRLYPQLKKSKEEIEFGYKVRIKGMEEKLTTEGREEEMKMVMLTEDMSKSLLDNIKGNFGLS